MEQNQAKKDTIIYGGAFNPPTRAHQAILQACVDYAEQRDTDVWLLPSGNRLDKTISATRESRLRMLRALIDDVVGRTVEIHVETSELDRAEQTETFDTVLHLNRTYPDRQFIWVFGSDSVETMPDWYMGEWMVDNLSMLVVERPGAPIARLGKNAMLLAVDTIKVSSTEVRARIAEHKSIEQLVSPSVLKYLSYMK